MLQHFDGIEIIGDEKFAARTKRALQLLRRKDKSGYLMILKRLRGIREHELSFVDTYQKVFYVGKKTAFGKRGLQWFASCIVHEAYHVELRARGKRFWGTATELQCIRAQIRSGRKIGMSSGHMSHLSSCDGTHWKLKQTW